MNNKTNYTPVLSERDRSLFRDLIESRVMTLTQISQLRSSAKITTSWVTSICKRCSLTVSSPLRESRMCPES